MNRNRLRIVLILFLLVLMIIFFAFDLREYSTLESIKNHQYALQAYYHQNTFKMIGIFGLAGIAASALFLPVSWAFALLSGALFGFPVGLVIFSFAGAIGATLAFLMARFILRDWVQSRYGFYLRKINAGFEREGAFYLFALRLVPMFPFFLVNLVTALLPMKTWTFYWVTQTGMLAISAVVVYAGTEFGRISSFSDVTSLSFFLAIAMIGIFPLAAKWVLDMARSRKKIGKPPTSANSN